MTAAWMWARAELRARWKAWLLLGILAGVTVGVAAAGWAGARRTERAVPATVVGRPDPDRGALGERPRVRTRTTRRRREAPRCHRHLPVPRRLLHPGVQPTASRGREPVAVPRRGRGDADPHRTTRRRSPARPRTRRRDRGRREHPRPVRPRPRLDDGAGAGGRTGRGHPAAVRTGRGRHELPGAHEGRRHRQVGLERSRVDAVERLLREVRRAHAVAGQRVRRPARRSCRHPRVQRSRSASSSDIP